MTGMPASPRPIISDPAFPHGRQGRGASGNAGNRFEPLWSVRDPDWDEEDPGPTTEFLEDRTASIITSNDSPDIPFSRSLNPYRGCEHGCIYCYARPGHEYLGWSAGLDFESRILVKTRAAELLAAELEHPAWRPQLLAMSGVTDCYQVVERRLRLTRACLQVLAEYRQPVSIITKSQLVVRDIDLLQELARHQATSVVISLTSLDQELSLRLEPRASVPRARLAAVRALADAGIPVGVNLAPMIPGLTDHEIPALLAAAAEAGATWAGYGIVRLPSSVLPLFEQWLRERCSPAQGGRVLARLREVRAGGLNDPRFGTRMTGEGVYAEQLAGMMRLGRRRSSLQEHGPQLSGAAFQRRGGRQLSLFQA